MDSARAAQWCNECFFPNSFLSNLYFCIAFHKLTFKLRQGYNDGNYGCLMHCVMLTFICWLKPLRVGCSWIPSSCLSVSIGTIQWYIQDRMSMFVLILCPLSCWLKMLQQGTVTKLKAWARKVKSFPSWKNVRGRVSPCFSEWLTKGLKESFRLHVHLTPKKARVSVGQVHQL